MFLRGALPDDVADHDVARGDSDPGRERFHRARRQWLESRHDAERGANRSFGVVLVRVRVAEIDQQAVSHVARDVAVERLDRRAAGPLEGADHLAQVFGVHAPRERRRPHEITEHDSQLPAFGLPRCRACRPGSARALFVGQRPDRVQDALARTQRNTELRKLFRRDLREHVEVDLIVNEEIFVFPEPLLLEPVLDSGHSIWIPSAVHSLPESMLHRGTSGVVSEREGCVRTGLALLQRQPISRCSASRNAVTETRSSRCKCGNAHRALWPRSAHRASRPRAKRSADACKCPARKGRCREASAPRRPDADLSAAQAWVR